MCLLPLVNTVSPINIFGRNIIKWHGYLGPRLRAIQMVCQSDVSCIEVRTLLVMSEEENCSLRGLLGCTEVSRSVSLSSQPALNFCLQFFHLVFARRYSMWDCKKRYFWCYWTLLILLDSTRGDVSSKERIAVQLFLFFLIEVV